MHQDPDFQAPFLRISCKIGMNLDSGKVFEDSLPDDFHERPFLPSPLEFPRENLFAGTEIEFPFRHGHDDLPAHALPLQVGVPVVFSRAVVPVLRNRLVPCEFLQLGFIALMELRLVVLNEGRNGYIHGVETGKAFMNL